MNRYLMSKEQMGVVRAETRLAYLGTVKRFLNPVLSKPEIRRIAIGETRSRLIESGRFNSILGSLLLAIAMKFIERLIDKWLNDELFAVDTISRTASKGEPGYVS
jgi:hypothetical protein